MVSSNGGEIGLLVSAVGMLLFVRRWRMQWRQSRQWRLGGKTIEPSQCVHCAAELTSDETPCAHCRKPIHEACRHAHLEAAEGPYR
jgi:predicted amidophosphoribosyltransferase